YNRLLVETFTAAITSDPAWDGGWYGAPSGVHRGLRRHARAFAAAGFTPQLFNEERWRGLGYNSVEDFLTGFVEAHFLPQDPNNRLVLAETGPRSDVGRLAAGDLGEALSRLTARVFVIAIEEGAFFPLRDVAAEQALVPGRELRTV